MSSPHIITAPQLGVNEATARLIRGVKEGEFVRPGKVICHLETVKATFEVEAEREGYLLYCVDDGAETAVNQPLLMLCATPEQLAAARAASQRQQAEQAAARSGAPATKLAQRRAAELGVDLAQVTCATGIIQASDVERHAAALQPAPARKPIAELSWPADRRPVVIHGAGRGGQTVLECLQEMNGVHAVAFVDDEPGQDSERHGLPLYPATALPELHSHGVSGYALGVAGAQTRLRLLAAAKAAGFQPVSVIHPTAILSPSCRLGEAVFVKAGAIIETGTSVGDACIIDNGVVIAHHNTIHEACHLAPGAALGSGIEIGAATVVGIGASIATGCRLGRGCIVTPGTSIVTNFDAGSVIEGVPGKKIGEARGA